MKAAILTKLNEPLEIGTLSVPNPELGQVLVRIITSTICGAQIGEITGAKGPDRFLPHLMGHEGCGEVLGVGPGVSKVKVGDKVALHWRRGVGIEAAPPRYLWLEKDVQVGGGWVTTFNEISIVSENRVTPVGRDIPNEVISLMGCAVTTALGLINNEAKLKIGQSIVVIGSGGVGLNVIQGAHLVGGNPIVAIDCVPGKLRLAENMGASHCINTSEEVNFIDRVWKILGKQGADVVVDTTGVPALINDGLIVTAPNGRMVMVGQPHLVENLLLTNMRQNFSGKTLLDSCGGRTDPTVDIPRYLDLYRAGRLYLDALVTNRFYLQDVNKAIELVRTGNAGRVALEMP